MLARTSDELVEITCHDPRENRILLVLRSGKDANFEFVDMLHEYLDSLLLLLGAAPLPLAVNGMPIRDLANLPRGPLLEQHDSPNGAKTLVLTSFMVLLLQKVTK